MVDAISTFLSPFMGQDWAASNHGLTLSPDALPQLTCIFGLLFALLEIVDVYIAFWVQVSVNTRTAESKEKATR